MYLIKIIPITGTKSNHELLVNKGSEEYLINLLDNMTADEAMMFYITESLLPSVLTDINILADNSYEEYQLWKAELDQNR